MRGVRRMIQTIVVAYLLLVIILFFIQRDLLYHPTQSTLAEAEQQAASSHAKAWHNKAGELIGWEWPTAGESTATVLVLHGNAGSAPGRGYVAEPVRDAANADVFVLEY